MMKEKRKGFSILELATATAIFSVAMIALFGIFYRCIISSRQMYNYQLASGLVQSEIEFLRSLDYSKLKNCKDASFSGPVMDLQKLKGGLGKLTIEDYMNAHIKKVTASISWSEEKNNKSITMTTLIADRQSVEK